LEGTWKIEENRERAKEQELRGRAGNTKEDRE
jgi:hypothetical protein